MRTPEEDIPYQPQLLNLDFGKSVSEASKVLLMDNELSHKDAMDFGEPPSKVPRLDEHEIESHSKDSSTRETASKLFPSNKVFHLSN